MVGGGSCGGCGYLIVLWEIGPKRFKACYPDRQCPSKLLLVKAFVSDMATDGLVLLVDLTLFVVMYQEVLTE
jgi:hypothetical protein